ncbi:hypothetical protein K503DRAFT_786787 [Rhizopogon vinicolor AM-OR11-026]|uniref:Uncharacterized protein n=1 Tax=Rhizopogon vinicolor AM-OR11-026 TaxID=1314800 RepID=A0A1B7MKA6_9AGAM|nr:hypothetical protein K503DRAFT_786787 [Rhizopogon vinicolor AM-OR11-026]
MVGHWHFKHLLDHGPFKRLLWHPRHVTSQNDLQFMKSPDPAFGDLFAVGSASWRVDLIRLGVTRVARNNVLSSVPVVTLPVCNSSVDPNYLAVGLDKVCGGSSLIIWDVQSATPSLSLSPSSTLVSNAAPGHPQPRIARADVIGHCTGGRVLQQHAPTEIVSALAFLPQSVHLLLAGISARWLRLSNLRTRTRTPTPATTNIATKVHEIVTSPIDPHQIACCGDGILTFTEKDAAADGARTRGGSSSSGAGAGSTNSNTAGFVDLIEFSSSRRGVLAAREKDTSYGNENFANRERFGFGESLQLRGASSKRSWAPWNAAGSGMRPSNVESQKTMVLVLSAKNFHKPLASFALVHSKRAFSLTSGVMVINDLELYDIHDTPKQASWSARGALTIGTGLGCKVLPGFEDRSVPPQPWDVHVEEETATRGRGKTVRQPMFGKGDGDGFPLLDSNASPSKMMKARTYSPASFRHYPLKHSVVRSKLSAPLSGVSDQIALKPPVGDEPKPKDRRQLAEKSSSRVRHWTWSVSQVVEDDISMMMHRRAIRRYGLASAKHNAQILQEDPCSDTILSELWAWIHSPLSTSAVLDPLTRMRQPPDNFVYGDFAAAAAALCARRTGSERPSKAPVRTNKLEQRRLEKEGHLSRAACWLAFTRQYQRALELLMRSDDEMHNLVCGALAALIPNAGGTPSNELRDHTERLIVRLRDPYFRVMLSQLTSKDWSEVLEEELLPLRERLAIAFWKTKHPHSTFGARPTGPAHVGYVDRTGDVQTAAIIGAHASPAKFADARAERCLETYKDWFKLFHHRVAFDIERGQILQDAVQNVCEWAPMQILIRCNYCSKPMNPVLDGAQKGRPNACPHCSRALPRCSVCLMTLSIVPDRTREAELLHSHTTYQDTIDEAIVICQTCRHGGHASHILDWFFGEDGARWHGMCPVADYDCHCVDEFWV